MEAKLTTIAASGGCERARKEYCRFAARARRSVNDRNEIHFDVYDNSCVCPAAPDHKLLVKTEKNKKGRQKNLVSSMLSLV